jgi:DNA-binding response OmpR family regulator
MKILLLEDDYLYKITIKDFLESNGYIVDDFESGDEALEAIYTNTYTLLLLDIRVPEIDGYTILKEIRENGIDIPVVMLTSLTDIDNLSLGYELGCSDYLRKPFELKELKYRLEHLIRTYHFNSSQSYKIIDTIYKFDIKNNLLLKDDKPVDLTAHELQLVSFLVQNKGRFISLDTLQNIVWEGREITYADIRMCIKRVRDKCDKEFIKTKKFVGYKVG